MILRRMMCCGLVELTGLSAYSKNAQSQLIDAIAECHSKSKHIHARGTFAPDDGERARARSYRLLLFSEACCPGHDPSNYGQRLVDLIQSRGLGKVSVISDEWGLNPNSGNRIKVWAWEIDHKEFWLQYAEGWKRSSYSATIRQYWQKVANEDARALAADNRLKMMAQEKIIFSTGSTLTFSGGDR